MSTVAPISSPGRLRTIVRDTVADTELAVLRWLVPLALLHGLLYLVIAPPWQHYDEPAHFLYAAEIAAGEVDARGPASAELRRAIDDSMYRFRFYPPDVRPDPGSPTPPEVGLDQRVHPPLYYALAALPVRLLADQPVEQQLFAARAVGLALYLLTVVVAWRIAVVLVPDEPLMQRVIPLLVLLSPAFTEIMTAVNNDVLLNFSLAAATLGSVLLIRDGLRPAPLALVCLGMLVAFMAKRTALVMVVPLVFVFIWAALRRPLRWWVIPLILAAAAAVVGAASFTTAVVPGPDGDHVVLSLRPWLAGLDERYLRLYADQRVRSFTDLTLIGDLYKTLVVVAFSGLYGHFGWGQIALAPAWIWALAGLSLAAAVGLIVGGLRSSGELTLWQRRSLWLFLIMVSVAWFSLFVRLHPIPPPNIPIYIPRARYMFWAMLPTLWLLALGLSWATPERWRRLTPYALVALFACLTLTAALWTLVGYYYR